MNRMESKKKNLSHFSPKQCANDACSKIFEPKTYNGVYCSAECRKVFTNKKLLDKYHTNKKNKFKKRICITPNCTTILSIYNKEKICERCKIERYIARLSSWGWDEEKLREEF